MVDVIQAYKSIQYLTHSTLFHYYYCRYYCQVLQHGAVLKCTLFFLTSHLYGSLQTLEI